MLGGFGQLEDPEVALGVLKYRVELRLVVRLEDRRWVRMMKLHTIENKEFYFY